MKKLESIQVDIFDIYDLLLVKGPLEMPFPHFPGDFLTAGANRPLRDAIKRSGVKFVCETFPDKGIIGNAYMYLWQWPDAQRMFWHYLNGTKEEVEFDINRVFRDDPSVLSYAIEKIREAMKLKKISGDIPFEQWRFRDKNWLNAFGGVHIMWNIDRVNLNIWIEDTYKWNPKAPRYTQCVHEAMERAKNLGAGDFHYHSTVYKLPIIIKKKSSNMHHFNGICRTDWLGLQRYCHQDSKKILILNNRLVFLEKPMLNITDDFSNLSNSYTKEKK